MDNNVTVTKKSSDAIWRGLNDIDIQSTKATAAEWLQTFPASVLSAAARGEIDLNALARMELANRGLNQNGKWVGFEAAANHAKLLPVRLDNGGVTFVSIPESE